MKLETRRNAVSSPTLGRLNSSRPVGPPAVLPTSTAFTHRLVGELVAAGRPHVVLEGSPDTRTAHACQHVQKLL